MKKAKTETPAVKIMKKNNCNLPALIIVLMIYLFSSLKTPFLILSTFDVDSYSNITFSIFSSLMLAISISLIHFSILLLYFFWFSKKYIKNFLCVTKGKLFFPI